MCDSTFETFCENEAAIKWVDGNGKPISGPIFHVKENGTAKFRQWISCSRCGGAGASNAWERTGKVCYKCSGTKGEFKEATAYSPEAYEKVKKRKGKLAEKAEIKRQEAEAKRQEFLEAEKVRFKSWAKEHKDIIDMLEKLKSNKEFIKGMKIRVENGIPLTEDDIESIKREAEEEARKQGMKFFGKIGERYKNIEIEDIIRMASIPTQFGTMNIYRFNTVDGEQLVYKGSSYYGANSYPAKVDFTVKAHDTYRDEKQTQIQRVKIHE